MEGCSKGRDRGETVDVASFSPNAWGLYNMHGNIREWCEDLYNESYPNRHVSDPKGPTSGSYRVLRGGCYDLNAWNMQSAHRGGNYPVLRHDHNGFRVARTR